MSTLKAALFFLTLLGANAHANDMLQGADKRGLSCETAITDLLKKYEAIVESPFVLERGDRLVIESLSDLDPGTLLIKKEILARTESAIYGTTKYAFVVRGSYNCDGLKVISAELRH